MIRISDDPKGRSEEPFSHSAHGLIGSSAHRTAGFTLIELSMVLIIISLIAGAFLTLGTKQTDAARRDLTHQRLDAIERAMGTFVLVQGRLPCPALGNASFASSDYAVEEAAPCSATKVKTSSDIVLHVGTIPIAALGLADEYMLDGWNHRITYAVDGRFVTPQGFMQKDPDTPWEGAVKVLARDSAATDPPERTDMKNDIGAAFILLSHGPNGHGAWAKEGGNKRLDFKSTNAGEEENAHDPTALSSFNAVFTQDIPAGKFDDILRYYLRWQTIRLAGGINDPAYCRTVWRASKQISEVATPPEGPVGCRNSKIGDPDYNEKKDGPPYDFLCMNRQKEFARLLLALCFMEAPKKKEETEK